MVSFQTYILKYAIQIRPTCKILLDYFLQQKVMEVLEQKVNAHSANSI